jgi:two-component system, LytTR family, sensor kinase
MKKIAKYRYFGLILHALTWGIVLFFPYFISSADSQYKIGPLPGLYFTLSGVVHMIVFYTHSFYLYPKLLNRAYWWLYIVTAVSLIVLSIGVKFYILSRWFPNDLANVKSHVLFPSVIVFIVSILYSITVEKIRTEKLQKENEALQLGMELKFLRSQISPHFLFNILTNLVSLARKKSDKLEASLLMLSGLMRYMLYDAGKRISLQQEVEYLESYVALQKLRFGGEVNIIFSIELSQEENNYNIEPMMLIPFVENAFKHGTDYQGQPFINIHLTAGEGVLHFQVKNKFSYEANAVRDETSGIGLSNVQSRLKLLYPGSHKLQIHSSGDEFDIDLTLKLL